MFSAVSGLADYLKRDGLLNDETAAAACKAAKQQGIALAIYLVRSGMLTSNEILACSAKYSSLPVFDLKNYHREWLQNSIITTELIDRYQVIPLNKNQEFLLLGMTDPTDNIVISAIRFHTDIPLRFMLVNAALLDELINTHCRPVILYSHLESAISNLSHIEDQSMQHDMADQNDEPVTEFVDYLLRDAINKHVSDIHIEPQEQQCRIRFRRDGLLYEAATIPMPLAMRISTRLKIMAQLDIAERRLPQDGRIQLSLTTKFDIRINTCPTIYGEKIALRLLKVNYSQLSLDALGLHATQTNLLISALSNPHGLILVTGPTGSGKTTTLYAALHYLNQTERNISTVEDPVEIELAGINQVNINPKIGLDFAAILRTFLRQDPDILMIGEIRDSETALIAMQAAHTGHLVLSTLHTNNAIETITRLQSMGIAAYHLINSISLIIAQRLVRKLCEHCKQPEITTHGDAYRAIGCERCHQGYVGRLGIFEMLPVTGKLAEIVLSGGSTQDLLRAARAENMKSLWDMAIEKVRSGATTHTELLRVLGPQP